MTAIALTIAGSDSGGGAGIQADLKTFSALGAYGASVLTALTAQNTTGVSAIHDVPAEFIAAQMDAVFSDLDVDAVKIGMLSQPQVIAAVADGLKRHNFIPTHGRTVVLDPVMVAESGDPLLAENAITSLIDHLFPLASVITPNLHEAARLLNTVPAKTELEMEKQAAELMQLGANAVLLKGGHSEKADASDVLIVGKEEPQWFRAPFIKTENTHGTGCSLSSAIAARMAQGDSLTDATAAAKRWLSKAIAHADGLQIGKGAGPVHHFHGVWST